jgi:hypothetical protein
MKLNTGILKYKLEYVMCTEYPWILWKSLWYTWHTWKFIHGFLINQYHKYWYCPTICRWQRWGQGPPQRRPVPSQPAASRSSPWGGAGIWLPLGYWPQRQELYQNLPIELQQNLFNSLWDTWKRQSHGHGHGNVHGTQGQVSLWASVKSALLSIDMTENRKGPTAFDGSLPYRKRIIRYMENPMVICWLALLRIHKAANQNSPTALRKSLPYRILRKSE